MILLDPLHPWQVLPYPSLRRVSSLCTSRAALPQPLLRRAPQGAAAPREGAPGVRSHGTGAQRPYVFPIRRLAIVPSCKPWDNRVKNSWTTFPCGVCDGDHR